MNEFAVDHLVVACWNLLVHSFCGQPFRLNKKSALIGELVV
jgi:hypothetical protein